MFRHRQQLRHWAARVLLVWLFGIATGVAHACVFPSLMELGKQRSESATAAQGGAATPASEHCHPVYQTPDDGTPGHDGSPAKSNCQDYCEKSTVSIPPLKSALDNLHDHALPPPAVAVVLPVPAFTPEEPLLPRRDGGLVPLPISIALLRLAL
ncbi:MAG: hypothetical protein HYX43_07085 [Burkholderiales bacterium]|nr:hypothetical protein [Burkholderiales bacterium]